MCVGGSYKQWRIQAGRVVCSTPLDLVSVYHAVCPDTLLKALKVCDCDVFSNIKTFLRLACTLSVTSVETERCNSCLTFIKNKFRSCMTEGRLTSPSILKIYYGIPVNIEAAIDTFAAKNSDKMRMSVLKAVNLGSHVYYDPLDLLYRV